MKEEHKISWRALRYSHTHNYKIFQIGMAFIFGIMVVLSLAFKNYLFGIFILITSIMLLQIKKNENPYINIDIDNNGISTKFQHSSLTNLGMRIISYVA
nr:hypothetical protein BACY1_00670 [Tenacibaculum mesophilum]